MRSEHSRTMNLCIFDESDSEEDEDVWWIAIQRLWRKTQSKRLSIDLLVKECCEEIMMKRTWRRVAIVLNNLVNQKKIKMIDYLYCEIVPPPETPSPPSKDIMFPGWEDYVNNCKLDSNIVYIYILIVD